MARANVADAVVMESHKFIGLCHVQAARFKVFLPDPRKDPKPDDEPPVPKLVFSMDVVPLDQDFQPNAEDGREIMINVGDKMLTPDATTGAEYRMCPAISTGRDDMAPAIQGIEVGAEGNCLDANDLGNYGFSDLSSFYKFGQSLEACGFTHEAVRCFQCEELVDAILLLNEIKIVPEARKGKKALPPYNVQIVERIIQAPNCPDFVAPAVQAQPVATQPKAAVAPKVQPKPSSIAPKPGAQVQAKPSMLAKPVVQVKPTVAPAIQHKPVVAQPVAQPAPQPTSSEEIDTTPLMEALEFALTNSFFASGTAYTQQTFLQTVNSGITRNPAVPGTERIKKVAAVAKIVNGNWEDIKAGISDITGGLLVDGGDGTIRA